MVRQLLRALTARSAQAADRAAATPAHDEAGSTEPVDASARRPAARDRPARQAATVHDTDPPGVDTGTDADTPGVVSVERPWQERGEELERWWAEMGRQVLAEVAARPERGPEGPPDAPPHEERRVLAGLDGVPERGPVGPRSDPPDLAEWAPIDGEPAHADPPPDAPAPLARLPGPVSHGWWAAADRAVDDAGAAVDRTRTALGHARRLVRTAGAADAADESTWAAGPAGRASAAEDALAALAAAADEQRDELAWLLSATAEGGLADRPRVALTDAVTGALIALTDLPGLRRAGHCGAAPCRRDPENCVHDLTGRPGLGAPVPTPAYRPGAELDRWVRARDRRCRFPGCRRRVPRGGELDHHTRWPEGATSAENLAGYCTADHRGKHQAPGWRHDLAPDGTLTVTTPAGLTAVTTPPPY